MAGAYHLDVSLAGELRVGGSARGSCPPPRPRRGSAEAGEGVQVEATRHQGAPSSRSAPRRALRFGRGETRRDFVVFIVRVLSLDKVFPRSAPAPRRNALRVSEPRSTVGGGSTPSSGCHDQGRDEDRDRARPPIRHRSSVADEDRRSSPATGGSCPLRLPRPGSAVRGESHGPPRAAHSRRGSGRRPVTRSHRFPRLSAGVRPWMTRPMFMPGGSPPNGWASRGLSFFSNR